MIFGGYKTHKGVRYLLYSATVVIEEPTPEDLRVVGDTPGVLTNWIVILASIKEINEIGMGADHEKVKAKGL